MANFYKDNDDLRYYFERGIDWEPIVRANEADFRAEGAPADLREALDFYRDTVEMVGEFVATEIAPHAAEIDREAVPLALRGVRTRAASAAVLLRRNLLVYGLGGMMVPFIGIKLIDLLLAAVGLA